MEAPIALVLDLIDWVAKSPRPYVEVMRDWRTSCPRLPVWEDAIDARYIECRRIDGKLSVIATERGKAFLAELRPC